MPPLSYRIGRSEGIQGSQRLDQSLIELGNDGSGIPNDEDLGLVLAVHMSVCLRCAHGGSQLCTIPYLLANREARAGVWCYECKERRACK